MKSLLKAIFLILLTSCVFHQGHICFNRACVYNVYKLDEPIKRIRAAKAAMKNIKLVNKKRRPSYGNYKHSLPDKKSDTLPIDTLALQHPNINIDSTYRVAPIITESATDSALVFNKSNSKPRKLVINYSNGIDSIDENKRMKISEFIESLCQECYSLVEVVGYTDSTGSEVNNQKLSILRAQNVSLYLISIGISKSKLMYRGDSSRKPVTNNNSSQGRALNRRVEIVFR